MGSIFRGIFLTVNIPFLTGTVKLVPLGWLPTVDRTSASVFPSDMATRRAGGASGRPRFNRFAGLVRPWGFAGSCSGRPIRSGLGGMMPSKRRRLDPVGPFGNPDGSRADLEDVISEFVDFGGDPAYGHLATRANDSMVRVIVGKLGAGKTVYLRRLQDFQAHQDSVYADVPQQSLPKTEVVVKACQWFSDRVLVEKWMQIWERAIMRSLASHLLCRPELRQQLRDEQADEIEHGYARLLDDFRRPRSIYSQVRDIVNRQNNAHQLSAYLDDPLWDDLEEDRKSTRLNSSHPSISYAVFCLKKKKNRREHVEQQHS